jgi:FKBP-type peptidyl-prolyl cis-trans isomerase (trigger factor)
VKKIIALIAALSLVTLSACGSSNSAATLGKITITQTELQTTVDTILKEREGIDTSQMQLETGATLNRSQLRFRIITTIFDEIAKELKLEVTKTEIATTRAGLISQSGGDSTITKNLVAAQIASTNFDRYVRAIIISDKITNALKASGVAEADVSDKISQLVSAKGKQLKISVNPRYGKWDQENGDIVAVEPAGDAVQVPATK